MIFRKVSIFLKVAVPFFYILVSKKKALTIWKSILWVLNYLGLGKWGTLISMGLVKLYGLKHDTSVARRGNSNPRISCLLYYSKKCWVLHRSLPKEYTKEEESQLLISLLLTLKSHKYPWVFHFIFPSNTLGLFVRTRRKSPYSFSYEMQ